MHSGLDRAALGTRLLLSAAALGSCGVALAHVAAPLQEPALIGVPLGLLATLIVGSLLLRRGPSNARTLWVLCLDVGVVGLGVALLPVMVQAERFTFVAGYLVAALVSAVGHRRGAAIGAAAAGSMVSLLGIVLLVQQNAAAPDLVLGFSRVLVVVMAAAEVAWVSAAVHAEAQRHATQALVARELRTRDAEADELLLFAQALAQSEGPHEVAEALLKHLRRHFEVRAHALALEGDGEVLAFWEERGRLEGPQLADRRERLQQALAEAGHPGVIGRVTPRSLEAGAAPREGRSATWVTLPLKVQETVVGVVVLSDPAPQAVPPPRLGVLADLARRTGEALARIGRARGEETRRTSMLLRQMREGVLLLGPEGRALLANPAAREALGMGREDTQVPERLGDVALAELARTPAGVARHFRAQVGRGESARPLELSGTAVGILDSKKRVGTLVTLRDVTEEELARRRLMQAEKMTLVGQTLAGVAHELNNPLAALVGYADLLQHAAVPQPLQRPIQQMREQALRATRIVRNLLNFARRRNPQRVSVQIGDLVNSTVELFAYEARMNEVTVDVTLDSGLPPLLADPHALQQVLVNLVQNAIHALAGSPRTPRRVAVRAQVQGEAVVVSVADNGPGVPEALAARVFEPFFTTKAAGHGTGLGLALARAVAREHGGDLGLEADRSEGACFTLRLPLRAPPATAEPGGDVQLREGRLPTSVLVVDDEASVRESLVAQLGSLGLRVDSAADIQEAQRMLGSGRYEALLVDVRMPGGSGLDLHARLRALEPALAQRMAFMTGDIVNDDVLASLRRTGNPFLEKPFTLAEMRRALGAVVARGAADTEPPPGSDHIAGVRSWFSSSSLS